MKEFVAGLSFADDSEARQFSDAVSQAIQSMKQNSQRTNTTSPQGEAGNFVPGLNMKVKRIENPLIGKEEPKKDNRGGSNL
jgi:hypothetical protein